MHECALVTPQRSPTDQLNKLFGDYHSTLLFHVMRLTGGDRGWAEDITQETFIRAWRNIERMSDEYGSVGAWLFRVAHNLVMDGYRARRSRPVEVDEARNHSTAAPDPSDGVVDAMVVSAALNTLSENHRVVLEHTFLLDHTIAATAQELDLPVGTVKSRMYYALRLLRSKMA